MLIRFLNWAFARRVIADEGYLIRWHLIPQNRWCNIYLHRFNGPDPGRALHDHPWSFFTMVLRGGYTELIPYREDPHYKTSKVVNWWAFRRAEHIHTVHVHAWHIPTWTLVITGPKRRPWGFYTRKGWVPHYEYQGEA